MKKQKLTTKHTVWGEPKGYLLTGNIPKTLDFTPSYEANPSDYYRISSWNKHYEMSLSIPEVSEEIYNLMQKEVENNLKALKQKIWDYMAEHPTIDEGVIMSPETHDLIIEDIGYGDLENACYMYAKKFHFEMKESCKERLLRDSR